MVGYFNMKYDYIDTHAHLNLSAFDKDREEVIARTKEAGLGVFNVGTKESTSKKAVEISEANDNCYAIVGLHPIQTTQGEHDEEELGKGGHPFVSKGEVFNTELYRELAQSKKVIGIGECGFDYFHNELDSYAVQEEAFIAQIELANQLQLPLMIHTRNPQPRKESPTGRSVYEDVYEVLKHYAKVPFNVHFYAGTLQEAQHFFELGGTISFTGVVTFAKDYEEIIKNVPLELMHAETDCPFVSPVPYRGKRCEPQYVIEVYKKIAQIRGEDEEKVRVQLLQNVQNQYQI